MSNSIETEREHGKLVVRFVRPEVRNPLSNEVLTELEEILTELKAERTIGRLIFTGSENVFASGADLNQIGRLTSDTAGDFGRRGQSLMVRIAELPILTIAAINGYCFGGALDLALACRKRIAGPKATFCHPGAGLGIITGWGGTQRLPKLIGQARALEMFFTASPISAEEALRIGLVDAVAGDPVAASMVVEGCDL
jgi:enoyl-CoA hydratase/carnithine racemase